ncbi:sorbosone dehydrogenase family protein [Pontixanthobacter gangjinensis]|uniref:Sorbosone dehydrogenase family protein n=1 Tax=Pontixanthobacter gangjinensis TaxID=1028742 RepID=A0A6I4SJB4_9SPHN|nr:sorbosone dehydrogenase family protein [Pontixanthobacter gangjinensis]MXO55684.1 sorbosone dehydrogenase family protein [Pontixanthobacter gangjinensis]
MSTKRKILLWVLAIFAILAIVLFWLSRGDTANLSVDEVTGEDPVLEDPNSEAFPTINIAEPIGWNDGEKPDAAEGLVVSRFAEGLDHPRVMHLLPNGDVLVTLTRSPKADEDGGIAAWIANMLMTRAGATGDSANEIVLLRDTNGDGVSDERFVLTDELDSPSGMAYKNGTLFVANHDALLAFPFTAGDTKITGGARKLMDLPGGGGHWMRNVELNNDGTKIYVAVGSDTNIGDKGMEAEKGRAAIWEHNLESGKSRIFGAGLRNPNGLDWSPWTNELWTTVNERDMLGSDLVPDYLTNVPLGVHYGWPWFYFGDYVDRRVKEPMPQSLVSYTRKPEYALGPHVAALGFRFSKAGHRMGEAFGQGAFIARHGSWNRKPASGYDVVFVAFDDLGNPTGKPLPVLTNFLTGEGTTRGRPTWVEWAQDGALLVTDDTAGIIWRVFNPKSEPAFAVKRLKGESLAPRTELTGDPRAAFTEEFARKVAIPTTSD